MFYICHQRRCLVCSLHDAPEESASLLHRVRGPSLRGREYRHLRIDDPRNLELTYRIPIEDFTITNSAVDLTAPILADTKLVVTFTPASRVFPI